MMRSAICRRVKMVAPALAVVAGAALLVASSAFAGEPTGEYAVFKECPLSVPSLTTCIYNVTSSGEVKIGGTATKITNPIILQGGTSRNPVTEEESWSEAANGETLSDSPQSVEGGLLGIIAPESLPLGLGEIINKLVSEGLAGVNATTELVASPQYDFDRLASEEGVGLVMPVRIHLENTFLGSACYLGSASEPITLELTTGTTSPPAPNTPITGNSGTVEIRNGGKLIVSEGASAVDNSFSVPGASGCGGALLAPVVDLAIDLKLGLPSASGHNTAILDGTLEQASSVAVKESGESAKEKEERENREREERERREEEERRKEEEEGF